jgi:hypothetical protein
MLGPRFKSSRGGFGSESEIILSPISSIVLESVVAPSATYVLYFSLVELKDHNLLKVLLGIVHNDETVIPAREVVSRLGTVLPNIEHFEVSDQVLDSSINFYSLTRHALAEYRIERRWRSYRHCGSFSNDITSATTKILKVIKLFFSKDSRTKASGVWQIEKAVTKKHLKAWEQFRNSPFDFLLLMEADASWSDPQSAILARTIECISNENPTYLSISGGLNMGALCIDELIKKRENFGGQEVLTFYKPVTNTSCAYIINRPLVDLLLDAASEPSNETWRQLSIDWYINSLFIHISGQVGGIISKLFNPPLIIHGSISGDFTSWHPDRRKVF